MEMKPRAKQLHNRKKGNEDRGSSSTERAELRSDTAAGGQHAKGDVAQHERASLR